MMPVTLLLIVPLFAMVPISRDPNGTLATILSYVPPFTPFVMMNRAAGPPSLLEYVATSVLLLVSIVLVHFCTDYFVSRVDAASLHAARVIVAISLAMSLGIFVAIVWRPGKSVFRRLLGMVHDVTAISAGIYLGEGAGAAVAVIYLWITIGNGFRYGVPYLYASAAASLGGFATVYISSEYWQSQVPLSLNILLTILIVSPFVGSLLQSLHTARDALQHQASTDALTGLMSRMEMETAMSSWRPAAVPITGYG